MALTKIPSTMVGSSSSNNAITLGVPIIENTQTISTPYTITANNSAMSVGPITMTANVTVGSGSRWVIL
jgi:hypothetical protein